MCLVNLQKIKENLMYSDAEIHLASPNCQMNSVNSQPLGDHLLRSIRMQSWHPACFPKKFFSTSWQIVQFVLPFPCASNIIVGFPQRFVSGSHIGSHSRMKFWVACLIVNISSRLCWNTMHSGEWTIRFAILRQRGLSAGKFCQAVAPLGIFSSRWLVDWSDKPHFIILY